MCSEKGKSSQRERTMLPALPRTPGHPQSLALAGTVGAAEHPHPAPGASSSRPHTSPLIFYANGVLEKLPDKPRGWQAAQVLLAPA